MIPVNLQAGLIKRLKNEFKELRLKNPEGKEVGINIYEQNLPELEYGDDQSLYPYIIVKLVDGEIEDESSTHMIKVLFVVGVFDDSYDNQGYKDVTLILQKLISSFQTNPVVDKKFSLRFPLRWVVHDEDVYPYYFGGLETNWETNAYFVGNIGGFLHG